MERITESIQKLNSVKSQLVSITNRVNALKKQTEILEQQPTAEAAAPKEQ
ncbi:hypothetical protein TVAG_129980 [Trichomonas vaginalis G3]|uniref:Uncharacterized protein n=1 Tax=Trichomonas vaginalis (strain ATCC PRA-98 / G3) TaxID=412133 RepID=A2DI94_TRIV3|nr:hypothetical protein TVAGG3_0712170 [Trichomonas vaginalis G3]EAY19890.1 hypothetical protein TVAG_129980 [Trichomonas vaginalis G3]KAI5509983.1 hypothetical protein TVAGG3_0712170 [Trichomonas vaginalis G3]|eukprot:XP_001580876.1 hypothetical protein [Trichomonas vaginalis G3]